MEFQEIKDKVKDLESKIEKLSKEDKELINEMYQELFNTSVKNCNCRNVYVDSFFQIRKYMKENDKKRTFFLKNGVLVHWNGGIYSNLNLTDEVATDYLKKYPSNTQDFSKYPADFFEEKEGEDLDPKTDAVDEKTDKDEDLDTKTKKTGKDNKKK